MVEKGNKSKKKLAKLYDELEFSDISESEFEKMENRLLSEIKILEYERIIIVEGLILK
jgi:hypothetical protein